MHELVLNRIKALTAIRDQTIAQLHATLGALRELEQLSIAIEKHDRQSEVDPRSGVRHEADPSGQGEGEAETAVH